MWKWKVRNSREQGEGAVREEEAVLREQQAHGRVAEQQVLEQRVFGVRMWWEKKPVRHNVAVVATLPVRPA